jgi:putative methyltransferase (TIGR04325 family)
MISIRRAVGRAARALLPPIVTRWVRPPPGPPFFFSGNFGSHAEAAQTAASTSYQEPISISTTLAEVADARARIEQAPSVVLDSRVMQLLSAFLLAVDHRPAGQSIRVLDFGGSVGIHFFALAPVLSKKWKLDWTICELPALARAGAEVYGSQIRFVTALDELGPERFDVALASGSLPYVPDPRQTCDALLDRCDALIINRTPFIDAPADRLTVQHVQFGAGVTRYPAWFMSRERWFKRIVERGFTIELSWPAPEDRTVLDDQPVGFAGLLARRRA